MPQAVSFRTPEGRPRALDEVIAALDARVAGGARRVELVQATDADVVGPAVAHAVAGGSLVRVELAEDVDDPAVGEAARDAGASVLAVPVRSPHDAGGRLLAEPAPHGVRRVALVPVDGATVEHLPELTARCAASGTDLELHRHLPRGPRGPALADAVAREVLDAAWARCRSAGVAVRFVGLGLPPGVPALAEPGAPPVLDGTVVDVLRADLPLPSLEAGVVGSDPVGLDRAIARVGDVATLGRLLGAVGWPVHDLPRCLGGLGAGPGGARCEACPGGSTCAGLSGGTPRPAAVRQGLRPGARVHVLIPFLADRLMVQAGLPGLVERLRERGAEVTVHSAWHAPSNPHGPPLDAPTVLGEDDHARHEAASGSVAAFARGLDLRGAEAVVAPGWAWGGVVLRHPSLPSDARVVVADDHLLDGVDGWKRRYLPPGARSLVTRWWPDPRVHVHTAFPGYARLFWYAGVPLEQVWWRPYPVNGAALPVGPAPRTCTEVLAAGSHLRDHATLARAAADAGPVVVISRERPTASPGLVWQGELPLAAFHARLAASRFVVVSVRHDAERAAGLSVVAMAQAAGRPVVATATPGTLDHVRHEHDGLLVPAGDAAALAAAVQRLRHDADLLDHLAAGARQAAARADVDRWAAGLLEGAPLATVPHPVTGGAPWRAW